VEIIYRDLKKSPFYHPSLTYYQRLARTLQRSSIAPVDDDFNIDTVKSPVADYFNIDIIESVIIPKSINLKINHLQGQTIRIMVRKF